MSRPATRTLVPGRGAFDLERLARRKAELGLRTSVVVPARDEERRIGDVVAALQQEMRPSPGRTVPLIDELVVVDGASSDGTVAAAERAGARVVRQDMGSSPGKGAALQLGVAATEGDLIAFVDADVRGPRPWLAVGTLAPLIEDESLRLVKSATQRSWDGAGTTGGGRVTELTVRPLIGLLWPALAHVAQPLGGEYAADRTLLESLPFERGYGVELGLLLDTFRHFGAGAIAQVDLGVRGHEHQPLEALGRMAAELVLVIADRLASEGRDVQVDDDSSMLLGRTMRDAAGALSIVTGEVRREALGPLRGISGGPLPARRGPSRQG